MHLLHRPRRLRLLVIVIRRVGVPPPLQLGPRVDVVDVSVNVAGEGGGRVRRPARAARVERYEEDVGVQFAEHECAV
jgi:hypothetical protein